MRRPISILVVVAVLALGATEAQAGRFRDSFAGQAIAKLINRLPQKPAATNATPAAQPGVMARLRAWAATPHHIAPPKGLTPSTPQPASAAKNGGLARTLAARWNAFTAGVGQRAQAWRVSSGALLSKLRSPQLLVKMGRRETLKTAGAAAQHEPTLWQRAQAIVKAKGQASTAVLKRQLNVFRFLSRQQNKQTLTALNAAAQQNRF